MIILRKKSENQKTNFVFNFYNKNNNNIIKLRNKNGSN